MDQRPHDTGAWSVYAGWEEEDAASREVRWELAEPSCPGSLNNQIEQLFGKDCEIAVSFFETIWRDGLEAVLEGWGVQRAKQARVQCQDGNSESSGEIFPFWALHGLLPSMWTQTPARPASSNSQSGAAAPAIEDMGCRAPDASLADSQEMLLPMTEERACRILKVSRESRRIEIRAAYHGMAGQWHPDRRGTESQDLQRLANRQMARINEAYRFLRGAPASLG